ncbi:MAG: hypothetical protein KatS3mg111_2054 [Pirellulaceae bacterium]|nr:MAG: hypothetical protein KatS3mg111_2054 [Pirellulaceae bacterium]
MEYRDYRFLGTTESLCPECLRLVSAKILDRDGRVYFRKFCPQHGVREDFVCADATAYDRLEYTVPARKPAVFGTSVQQGCPFDCGLCTEHEQHTCIGLVELTDACNLTCPMCYAASAPGLKHRTWEEVKRAIDRLVEVEDGAEVLQLSGGEPTIAPTFEQAVEYAMRQRIDYVQINTNGIRLAKDDALIHWLAQYKDRLEVFLQFDGLDDEVYERLRGRRLLETKLAVLDRLEEAGLNITLAVTLQAGVNEQHIGAIVRLAAHRRCIGAINFQPATYSGRHLLPDDLENRITFPDVIAAIEGQTDGLLRRDDFLPLPCAHPNCHQIAYAWRTDAGLQSIAQMIDVRQHLDLLANGISFTRASARRLVQEYLARTTCCPSGCAPCSDRTAIVTAGQGAGKLPMVDVPSRQGMAAAAMTSACGTGAKAADGVESSAEAPEDQFLRQVLTEQIGARDLLRITITSFLDSYNFDVRRVMKCCTHHVLPSGHVIPFCAFNTLYRSGHVPLPELTRAVVSIGQGG